MITTLYLIALLAGLVAATFGLLGLWRSFVPGHQAQPDISAQALRLLPLALGAGAAVFGAVGLVLVRLTDIQQGATVLWSLGAGLLVAFVIEAVLTVRLLRRVAVQPPAAVADEGLTARVVVTIPGNGVGEITYRHDGETISTGASSATFETIPAGSAVRIERVVRNIAIVRPVPRS